MITVTMNKLKETKNTIVYASEHVPNLYLQKSAIPSGVEVPEKIKVTIEAA